MDRRLAYFICKYQTFGVTPPPLLLQLSCDRCIWYHPVRSAPSRDATATGLENSYFQEEYVPQTQAEESRATGTVGGRLYLQFFYMGGGVLGLVIFAFLNLAAQISFILADWWLAYW